MERQLLPINFMQGMDTITDEFQLDAGKFVSLENSVFIKAGGFKRLQKRFGYSPIGSINNAGSYYLTTFNGGLIAAGSIVRSYSNASSQWSEQGSYQPLSVSVSAAVRTNYNYSQCDSATLPNGLTCLVYMETIASADVTQIASVPVSSPKYMVIETVTGNRVLGPSGLFPTFGTCLYAPKVFSLANNFVIVFDGSVGSVSNVGSNSHLQFQYIRTTDNFVSSVTEITNTYKAGYPSPVAGVTANNTLYLAWGGTIGSQIQMASISSGLALSSIVTVSSASTQSIAVAADVTGSTTIWSTFSSNQGANDRTYALAVSSALSVVVPTTRFGGNSNGVASSNMTVVADAGRATIYWEGAPSSLYFTRPTGGSVIVGNNPVLRTIEKFEINTAGTTSSAPVRVSGDCGIGSKAFFIGSTHYLLASYNSTYQSTYFLINSSGATLGLLSYGDGFGQYYYGSPSATVLGSTSYISYLTKTKISTENKGTNVSSSTPVVGIYSQYGINLASFEFTNEKIATTETAGNLQLNGGQLWTYDGVKSVEHGFYLYPDDVSLSLGSGSLVGGSLAAQSYFYQAIFEWTDNRGNIFRSGPSIPVNCNLASGFSSIGVYAPTYIQTNKDPTSVNVKFYRWSQNQPTYYLVSSQSAFFLQAGSYTRFAYFNDVLSDSQIAGNEILYTTGGIIENGPPPVTKHHTTFDSRLWVINGEDPNQLIYSQSMIENSPLDLNEFYNIFVPPFSAISGTTGPMECIFPMDDKLIIFKKSSIFYINGTGPNPTGSGAQYSDPIFVTAGTGTRNQASLILCPPGLLFQTEDNGIWMLGRDLSVSFVGKDVYSYKDFRVSSAVLVPGTSEVRFTLTSGTVLVYNYLVNQWSVFGGLAPLSSTIYNGAHTLLSLSGSVSMQMQNSYADNGVPTTMSFKTGWINFSEIQTYKRAYSLYLLGKFVSPHTFSIGISYDYNPDIVQMVTVNPTNTVGSGSSVEEWEINLKRQQCQSIQLTLTETSSQSAGAGFYLSGLNILVGMKRDYPLNLGKRNRIG